jgi:hypothetical protein
MSVGRIRISEIDIGENVTRAVRVLEPIVRSGQLSQQRLRRLHRARPSERYAPIPYRPFAVAMAHVDLIDRINPEQVPRWS